jgi:phage-related protein
MGRGILTIVADSSGLRSEVNQAVRDALVGVRANIPVMVNVSGLRAEASQAIRTATAGLSITIPVRADTSRLRDDVRNAVQAASAGQRITVPVHADASGLRARVINAVQAATAGLSINIPIHADMTNLRDEVRVSMLSAATGLRFSIPADVDASTLRDELHVAIAAATVGLRIVIPVHADATWLRDEVRIAVFLASAGLSINIPVHADASSLHSLTSMFGAAGADSGQAFGRRFGLSLTQIMGLFAAAVVPATAAVLALGSSLGLAAAAGAAMLPAMMGAVATAGTLKMAFSGAFAAIKLHSTALGQASSAASSNAGSEEASAARIRAAQTQIADARRAQSRAARDGAEQVRAAEDRLAEAQEQARDAQESLTRARAEAREELEEYRDAARDAALDEESAQISLLRARERLVAANRDATASELDRREARLAVAEAEARLQDATERNVEAQRESADADRRGVEGSGLVVAAKRDQARAADGVADASRSLARTQEDAADRQEQAAMQVARAMESLASAQRETAASSAQGSSAAAQYAQAMANLSPAAREFVQTVIGMRGALAGMRLAAESSTLPGFTSMLRNSAGLVPIVTQHISAMGTQIGAAAADVGRLIATPLFQGQLRNIFAENEAAARSMSGATASLVRIFMDVSEAAAPLVSRLAEAFANGARTTAAWLDLQRETGALARFFTLAGDEMSKWWTIAGNVLTGIGALFVAAAPAGMQLSSSIESISAGFKDWATSESTRQSVQRLMEFVAGIDVQRLTQVAMAVGALGLAMRGMSAAQGVMGVVTMLAGLGPVGLVIGGVTLAVGALAAGLGYLYLTSATVRDAVRDVGRSFVDNFAGPLREVRAGIDVVVPILRDVFLTVVRDLSSYLSDHLFPALREIYDMIAPRVREAFAAITQTFRDNQGELTGLYGKFKTVVNWITDNVLPVLGLFGGMLVDYVSGSIRLTITILAAFSTALDTVGRRFETVRDRAVEALNSVTTANANAWNTIRTNTTNELSAVGSVVSSGMNAVRSMIGAILDIIRQLFQIAWDWINQLSGGRLNQLRDTVVSSMGAIRTAVSTALDAVRNAFAAAWAYLQSATAAAWAAIRSTIASALAAILSAVSSALSAVRSAISSAWSSVQSTTMSAWSAVRTGISNAWSGIVSNVSSALSTLRAAVSNTWSAVQSGTTAAWNGIRSGIANAVSGIGSAIANAFRAIPRTIVGSLNAVLSGVNSLISRVNGILPGSPIPPLGSVTVPAGYARGGWITGPGTGTSDDVPILASNGEYVLRAKAVEALRNAYGSRFLDGLNEYDIGGDPSALVLARRANGGEVRRYANGGSIGSVQSFIRSTDPRPYVWGGVGPFGWDCSGLVGSVYALLTGRDPYRRYFTTTTLPGAGGFQPGHGAFTIGLSPSHVVGNLSGLPFEARGRASGILVGGAARSVDDMPAQYFLPQVGGQFVGGGGGVSLPSLGSLIAALFSSAVAPLRAGLPQPGGFLNPLVTGLFDQSVSGLRSMATSIAGFDEGGPLPPGLTLAANRTGRTEQVLSPGQIDRLAGASGGGVTYNFEAGAIVLDASKLRSIDDLVTAIDALKSTSRQYGAR